MHTIWRLYVKKKIIYCERCSGEIHTKEELIVVGSRILPTAYHDPCYIKDLKQDYSTLNGKYIINRRTNKIVSLFIWIVGIVMMFVTKRIYLILAILFISQFHTLYSWLCYERHLP